MKVKICGIRRMEDVEIINRYLPDYAGFVFAKSKRQVLPDEAKRLAANIDGRIKKVGVFVDQPIELLAELLIEETVDYLQLHGGEDTAYERKLCQILEEKGIKNPSERLIKAYRIKNKEDFEKMSPTACKYLLLDAFSVKCEGGNGESFDWSHINKWKTSNKKPFFLAGGIGLHNVKEAIADVKPYAIDVSSSLEENGFKSEEKIKEFMERIKEYE